MKTTIQLLFFLFSCCTISHADTIYKSVDENGKVSYSTTPPSNAETSTQVDIAPPPSEARIKAAQDHSERNRETAKVLDENRKKRDEITAEEDRLKRENQLQLQLQKQAEQHNGNQGYGYPGYPRRPLRPIIRQPVAAPRR